MTELELFLLLRNRTSLFCNLSIYFNNLTVLNFGKIVNMKQSTQIFKIYKYPNQNRKHNRSDL